MRKTMFLVPRLAGGVLVLGGCGADDGGDPGAASPDGVSGEVATITRDDGTLQVTLDGYPLYLWQGDAEPGDTTGQGVQDVWWVVTPDGAKVTAAPAAASGY